MSAKTSGLVSTLTRSMRVPFLILAPVCVGLGASVAYATAGSVNVGLLTLIMAGALLAHISVNMLNEYHDFNSELDLNTVRTPFSGGSGALPDNPDYARAVLAGGLAALTGVIIIGLVLVAEAGTAILPFGLVGIVVIALYTGPINRNPFACLIAPGLGFGILMVVGTHIVLTGEQNTAAWLAALVPFYLTNNLLLLNQYPDIDADKAAGRRHVPIVYGVEAANRVYISFVVMTVVTLCAAVAVGALPVLALIALLPLPLAALAWKGAGAYGKDVGDHPRHLAANVIVAIVTPLLLAVGIAFG